jgi:hypothetical protein
MKLASVVFITPVKVSGNMAQSLTSKVEVGRLGTAAPVILEVDDEGRFVQVSREVEGVLALVPMSNVSCFVPVPTPAPAPSKK